MGAVKPFQCGNHINKKVPASFAQSPLPLESSLQIQTWHTKYPSSGFHYALESNVSFAGVAGIAFNISTLSQHRWSASVNWSPGWEGAGMEATKPRQEAPDVPVSLSTPGLARPGAGRLRVMGDAAIPPIPNEEGEGTTVQRTSLLRGAFGMHQQTPSAQVTRLSESLSKRSLRTLASQKVMGMIYPQAPGLISRFPDSAVHCDPRTGGPASGRGA